MPDGKFCKCVSEETTTGVLKLKEDKVVDIPVVTKQIPFHRPDNSETAHARTDSTVAVLSLVCKLFRFHICRS